MKRLLLAVPLLLLAGCSEKNMIECPDNNCRDIRSSEYVQGVFRVKLREGVPIFTKAGNACDGEFSAAMTRAGAVGARQLVSADGRFAERRKKAGLDRWYEVSFPEAIPVEDAMAMFGHPESVEVVEPVARMESVDMAQTSFSMMSDAVIPFNDPGASRQWHMFPTFPASSYFERDAHLNILPAWQLCAGDNEVIVAVMDGGIDYTHPDLKDAMWDDGEGHCGYNFMQDNHVINPSDHGTGVAAVIGAVNDNNEGICGIAGGDSGKGGVRLMSCQVFGDGIHPDIMSYMTYAADNGAVISQNSWNYVGLSDLSQYGKDAIDYFINNAGMDENGNQTGPMAGGIVVFAAGNDNVGTPQFPAAYPPVIAVASLSADFIKAESSNYGDWVDLSAFGGDPGIYTAGVGGYGYVQGTSIAAPQIAGLAALVVSHRGGPGFTNTMLKELLLTSGRKDRVEACNPDYKGRLGNGVPDADVIMHSGKKPQAVGNVAAYGRRCQIELAWPAPEWYDGIPVSGYDVYYAAGSLDGFDIDNVGKNVLHRHFSVTPQKVGDAVSCIVEGLERYSEYGFAVVSRSPYGEASEPVVLKASTGDNSAPYMLSSIENVFLDSNSRGSHAEIDLYAHFGDYDLPGDRLEFYADVKRNGVVGCREENGVLRIASMSAGRTMIDVVAFDEEGGSCGISFCVDCVGDISVYPNPFVDRLNVRVPGLEGEVPVCFYDRAGKTCLKTSVVLDADGKGCIDAGSLVPGPYSIVVSERKFTAKAVKK